CSTWRHWVQASRRTPQHWAGCHTDYETHTGRRAPEPPAHWPRPDRIHPTPHKRGSDQHTDRTTRAAPRKSATDQRPHSTERAACVTDWSWPTPLAQPHEPDATHQRPTTSAARPTPRPARPAPTTDRPVPHPSAKE